MIQTIFWTKIRIFYPPLVTARAGTLNHPNKRFLFNGAEISLLIIPGDLH